MSLDTIKPYYQDASCTIYHGDCREILPTLGKVDLLLTDPPYGIGADKNVRANIQGGKAVAPSKDYGIGNWDSKPPPIWLLDAARDHATISILWGGNFYGLPASPCWLVWDKDNGDNTYADCELAWTNMTRAVRKFKWKWHGMLQEQMGDKKEFRVHPTQKPVALMRWCLSLVPDAETILDPFAGSCTTGVAAKLEGRKSVLIEISESYCEAGAKRLSQGVLF